MSLSASTSSVRASLRRRPRLPRALATAADPPTSASTSASPRPPMRHERVNLARPDVTPAQAQEYLSNLLSLPPSAQFPPQLALQILTHKSYRFVHRIAHPPPYTAAELAQSQASHNGRLGFIGRRALAAYTAMFVHSTLPSAGRIHEADFLNGKDIETKLDELRNPNLLGHTVGNVWGVGDVMRWDRQQTGLENDFAKIKGLTVEAIVGGVFLQHGSPAAQRVFHHLLLPVLRNQLRDPILQEAAKTLAYKSGAVVNSEAVEAQENATAN